MSVPQEDRAQRHYKSAREHLEEVLKGLEKPPGCFDQEPLREHTKLALEHLEHLVWLAAKH